MSQLPTQQRNAYKGTPARCWIRLRFVAADGSFQERDLVADTGCPCAAILNQADFALLMLGQAQAISSNFGQLAGGWLELHMPELGLTTRILGFASDQVW